MTNPLFAKMKQQYAKAVAEGDFEQCALYILMVQQFCEEGQEFEAISALIAPPVTEEPNDNDGPTDYQKSLSPTFDNT